VNKNLEFLSELDKKVHTTAESTFTPNISGASFQVFSDQYTNESLNKEEIQRILKIAKRFPYIIYPINTARGFAVGFQVQQIRTGRTLLTFKESQLPKGHNFKTLSEHFMQSKNLAKAKLMIMTTMTTKIGFFIYSKH